MTIIQAMLLHPIPVWVGMLIWTAGVFAGFIVASWFHANARDPREQHP